MTGRAGLLRTIELIHRAALAPEQWPHALDCVAELLAGDHAVLHAGAPDGSAPPLFAYARLDPRDLAKSIAADNGLRAEFTTQFQLQAGPATTRASLVPDRDYERCTYYNEVLRHIDGFHCAYFLEASPAGVANVAVCRGRRFDDFDAAAIATLETLRPHFRLALETHCRLQLADARAASLSLALDRLNDGVILIDAQARPLHLNARAKALAAEADGLVLCPTGLAAGSPDMTAKLRATIAMLSAQGEQILVPRNGGLPCAEPVRMALARPAGRPPLILSLLPLRQLDISLPGVAPPSVAIFVTETDAEGIDRQAIIATFRLTPREADIAALLASGHEPAAIADELGIGVGTVRTHIKHLFAKTDTHSQVALAALVRRFARGGS